MPKDKFPALPQKTHTYKSGVIGCEPAHDFLVEAAELPPLEPPPAMREKAQQIGSFWLLFQLCGFGVLSSIVHCTFEGLA